MISVVIVQHNHSRLTWEAIASLRTHEQGGYEVIVVDNGSREAEANAVPASLGDVRLVLNRANDGFGSANDRGAALAGGDLLFFLNNDTRFTGSVLPFIAEHFRMHPKCGVAGLKLCNADGSLQLSSGMFPTVWSEWRMKRHFYRGGPRTDWVTGAALVIRRDLFEQIGGFDERYFLYFEDVDLCRRVRDAGWDIDLLDTVPVTHLGGGSQPGDPDERLLVEYRRSQLTYYALHASRRQNVLLRCYLLAKYSWLAISRPRRPRKAAQKILRLALRSSDAHRHGCSQVS